MDPRILDNHRRVAQGRINAAALKLAAKHGLDPALAAALDAYHDRDPATNLMRKQEAVADLLEALAKEPKRSAPQLDPKTGERPGDIGFKQRSPASATPQDAGAGGGEPPAPAAPPRQHAAVRERAKARGGK